MGTIKDLVDLTTQLVSNIKYRKFSAEILQIQSLVSSLQSEQLKTTENMSKVSNENITLKVENQKLNTINSELEQQISKLKRKILALKKEIDKLQPIITPELQKKLDNQNSQTFNIDDNPS